MARIIYSTQVSEIKGSIGGLTFHKSTAGDLCTLKPLNRNIYSKTQSDYKALFIELTSLWNSLNSDEKFNWTDEITGVEFVNRYNESKARTGFNYFMSCNIGRSLLYLEPFETIGNYQACYQPPAMAIGVNQLRILVSFASTSLDPNVYLFFYSCPPNKLPYSKQRTQFRLIQAQQPLGVTSFNLTEAYESAFGLNWPISSESNSFNVTIACCAFNVEHGSWSRFVYATDSFKIV